MYSCQFVHSWQPSIFFSPHPIHGLHEIVVFFDVDASEEGCNDDGGGDSEDDGIARIGGVGLEVGEEGEEEGEEHGGVAEAHLHLAVFIHGDDEALQKGNAYRYGRRSNIVLAGGVICDIQKKKGDGDDAG